MTAPRRIFSTNRLTPEQAALLTRLGQRVEKTIVLAECFSIEIAGETVIWDVAFLREAAEAGLFGPPVTLPGRLMKPIENAEAYIDRTRVENTKRDSARLNKPVIAIAESENVLVCFVDGNHRLMARWELALPDFQSYIVPADLEQEFRVTQDVIVKEYDRPPEDSV